MSPRSVTRSLRGEKTQAIIPLREFPWAGDLKTCDKIDLRAKTKTQVRSLRVEVTLACLHPAVETIAACGKHSAEAIAPWAPQWDRILNIARNARRPEHADERDQAGWIVVTYTALNEVRLPRKRLDSTSSHR
jgi:hypothetical protein